MAKSLKNVATGGKNEAIPGNDILGAFENYFEGRLMKEFESCKDKTEASTKINIAERTSRLKFDQRRC